jgi:hypothetical protein
MGFQIYKTFFNQKITFIYYPNTQFPIEQVQLIDVLEALQEANQNILHFTRFPQSGHDPN